MGEVGVSQRLRQALRESGLTVSDLAHGDLTPVYVELIAGGQIRPSLEVLQSLADRLGRPVSYFLEGLPGSRADVLLLLNLATSYLEQEDVARAQPMLEQAAKFAAEQGDSRIQGMIQLQFCRLARLGNDLDEAERRGTKALKLLQDHGEPPEIAQAMMYLGNVASVRRNMYEALARYHDALVVARSSADRRLLAMIHHNIGNTCVKVQDWETADYHMRLALELSEPRTNTLHKARLQINLALSHREKGDLDRALDLSAKALACLNEMQQPTITADIYNNMASIHAMAGERDKAREYYKKTLALLAGQQVRQRVEAQRELARLSLEEGTVSQGRREAAEAFRWAEEVGDPAERGSSALVCAQALLSGDRPEEALPYLETARQEFARTGMRQSLVVTEDLLTHVKHACRKEGDT